MKKTGVYFLYSFFAIFLTYIFQFILCFIISMERFSASESPPGDIGISEKLMYSIGSPLIFLGILFILFHSFHSFFNRFKIKLTRFFPNVLNIAIVIYLMIIFSSTTFDLFPITKILDFFYLPGTWNK